MAVTLSKRVSKYLHDYKSLANDYKEKYGKATDARDCEYRSIRLARSEINMAYRTAEQTRWRQMDFILGYEIRLSGSHPQHDICDTLAGRYPKDFVWTGWHPNDICYAVPIVASEEDFWQDNFTPQDCKEYVDDVPEGFKGWLSDNKQRVKYQNSVPYFLADNPQYVPEEFVKAIGTLRHDIDANFFTYIKEAYLKLKDPSYITDQEVKKMITDFAIANQNLFYGGLKKVSISRAKRYFMANYRDYYNTNGAYFLQNGNTIKISRYEFRISPNETFNPAQELKSAMRAIAEKRKLTFKEEYALESLWHEIRHASSKGWGDINKKTDELNMVMETVNQFCARRSYGQFVKAIGGKTSNLKDIIEKGYGYQGYISNFHKILRYCNISQSSAYVYLRDRIITTPYEEIFEDVTELLINRGGLKRKTAEALLRGLKLPDTDFDKLIMGA